MSDRNATSRMTLADALRALPPAAPTHDVWATLAARLAPPTRVSRRRYVLPAALAAGIALAAIALHAWHAGVPTQPATVHADATVAGLPASSIANDAKVPNAMNATNANNVTTSPDAQLAALQSRSRALEGWLRDTRSAASPLPGQDLAAATEIENLLGLVDVELAGPAHTNPVPLWRRRIALLEDLTALRYSNYQLAAGGRAIAAAGRID